MGKGSKHVLTPKIKVDKQEKIGSIDISKGAHLVSLQVDQRLDSPDYFALEYTTQQATDEQSLRFIDDLKLGQEVSIELGYEETGPIFEGEISYIEPRFGETVGTVTFSGYDFTHRLTRGTNSRTWGDGFKQQDKLGEVGKKVISDAKARKGDTSDSLSADLKYEGKTKVEYIPQVETSDYQFLRSLGVATGQVFGTPKEPKKVGFKAVDIKAEPALKIFRDNPDKGAVTPLEAEFSISSVRQVAMVEVRGWNPKDKKAVLGKATKVSAAFDGTTGPSKSGEGHYGSGSSGRVLTIIDHPVQDETEAKELAQSILDSLAMQYSKAEIVCEGNPKVAAGNIIEVKGFGKAYDGKYLAEACTHSYVAEGGDPYTIRLSLVRNATS